MRLVAVTVVAVIAVGIVGGCFGGGLVDVVVAAASFDRIYRHQCRVFL